jgi:hypothetical protein
VNGVGMIDVLLPSFVHTDQILTLRWIFDRKLGLTGIGWFGISRKESGILDIVSRNNDAFGNSKFYEPWKRSFSAAY